MIKTYLYIPEPLGKRIGETAQAQKRSKAEVMREALEQGILAMQRETTSSAEVLLRLADIGRKYKLKGPKDSSERIDELMWSKDWAADG